MRQMFVADGLESEVFAFLLGEAALLNERRFDAWLEVITDDFDYRMPSPSVQDDPSVPQFDEGALLSWESANSLRLRFQRMGSDFAWADRPPPRERRHVTSARVVDRAAAATSEEFWVASDVLVARSRRPDGTDLVSAGRRDLLRRDGDGLRLARRCVYIDLYQPNVTQISMIY